MIGALVAAWVGVAWGEERPACRELVILGNTVQEGPWQVKATATGGATTEGHVWGTLPGVPPSGNIGDAGTSYAEFFTGNLAGKFLDEGMKWEISVPASAPAIGTKCTSVDRCLRTFTTIQDTTSVYPTTGYGYTPNWKHAQEYHAVGHYEIVASNGTKADYYISKVVLSSKRIERICAPSGFLWPHYDSDETKRIAWTITWKDNHTYSSCDGTLHHFQVDVNP